MLPAAWAVPTDSETLLDAKTGSQRLLATIAAYVDCHE